MKGGQAQKTNTHIHTHTLFDSIYVEIFKKSITIKTESMISCCLGPGVGAGIDCI